MVEPECPLQQYAGIRPPMHPARTALGFVLAGGRILPVFFLLVPCGSGASAPSVQRRTYETDR